MCHTIIYLFESLGSLVLRLVPVALNRKSISRLLTAAGREKLLISAADLCKSRICLRSHMPFRSELALSPMPRTAALCCRHYESVSQLQLSSRTFICLYELYRQVLLLFVISADWRTREGWSAPPAAA
jgi:hypothetical protein